MRLSRIGALTWICALLVVALRLPKATHDIDALTSDSFPAALTSLVALLLLAVAGWAVVVLGGCMLGGAPARAAARLLPRAARGALLAGVATALTIGTAHADAGSGPPDHGPSVVLDGLSLPDRPVSQASVPEDPTPTEAEVVLVAPGDTVWAIAARSLGPGADDTAVADAADRWYTANRAVIGDDPDLIRPGQRLVAPQDLA